MNRFEKLTKGEMLELGMLITYLEASCILQVGKSQISNLVKEKRLQQVVYKKRQYISLLSILQYTGDLKTDDMVVFMQRVEFKPIDNETLKKNKEIRMVEKREWNDFWENIDKQIKEL